MKVSTLNLAALAISSGLLTATLWLRLSTPPPAASQPDPLAAIPAGAAFVATLDVSRLRRTEAGGMLLSAGREVPGVGRLDGVCGFDPTPMVESLAVVVGGPDSGREQSNSVAMGVVATGDFDGVRLADCAAAVIRRRGGQPGHTRIGSFATVRDRNGGGSEIAIRDHGPVLIGEGPLLRDMIDAADGRIPTVRQDGLHRALRSSLGTDAELVLSWVPRADWLERALGEKMASRSAFAAIRALGLRIDLTPGLRARAIVGCASESACRTLDGELRPTLERALNPVLGAVQSAIVARRLTVTTTERELHFELSISSAEATALVDRWLPQTPTEPPATPVTPSLEPDEVLRPMP